jgi:catechol-2,3-dioxygenase
VAVRDPTPADVSGLAELTLETSDLHGLERFYRDVLGLPVLSREDDRIWLATGRNSRLGLWAPGTKEFGDRGGRHVHFALSADSAGLERLVQRLRTEPAACLQGPVTHPGGDRSLYFNDPAGNVVEVWDFFCRGKGAADGVAALA